MKLFKIIIIPILLISCFVTIFLIFSSNLKHHKNSVLTPYFTKGSDDISILQAENDKKAIAAISSYFKKDFTGIAERTEVIQKDHSITSTTTDEQIYIFRNMVAAIQSEKLQYSEIRPIILYLAKRGDAINAAFKGEPFFITEMEKAILPFIESDPFLVNDIEIAYDPLFFGN